MYLRRKAALQVYKEVGYSGMLMPDHVPEAPGDAQGLQSFAFCYGYIRGLIQSANGLGERLLTIPAGILFDLIGGFL